MVLWMLNNGHHAFPGASPWLNTLHPCETRRFVRVSSTSRVATHDRSHSFFRSNRQKPCFIINRPCPICKQKKHLRNPSAGVFIIVGSAVLVKDLENVHEGVVLLVRLLVGQGLQAGTLARRRRSRTGRRRQCTCPGERPPAGRWRRRWPAGCTICSPAAPLPSGTCPRFPRTAAHKRTPGSQRLAT